MYEKIKTSGYNFVVIIMIFIYEPIPCESPKRTVGRPQLERWKGFAE